MTPHARIALAVAAVLVVALCVWFWSGRSKASTATQWVDPTELHPGPIHHEQLAPEQVTRITRLHEIFREVDPTPLSKWLEDFKRDRDPDREIRIYEGMAEAYTSYCAGRNLTHDAKLDVYQVVLLRSGASDDEVMRRVKLKVLAPGDAKEILAFYKTPPQPVTASPTPP